MTTDKHITVMRGSVKHPAEYAGAGSSRGTIVLIKWGSLQTLYRFNSKTGKGKGSARDWTIPPQDLGKVQTWLREDAARLKEKRTNV